MMNFTWVVCLHHRGKSIKCKKCNRCLKLNLIIYFMVIYLDFEVTAEGFVASWWRRDMDKLSTLLALCEGNPPVAGGFPSQRTSDVKLWCFFFAVNLNKLLNKHLSCWWFAMPSLLCDVTVMIYEWLRSQLRWLHCWPNEVTSVLR